ncbi:MAG: hypothetical protein HC896_12690 [Bacteroidales bacterium]|nr:hypothetical protein [Bacteroidales bacterium]
MRLLYNISIACYYLLIILVLPFNPKAKMWLRGRRSWYKILKYKLKGIERPVWVHCSSLGEFEQGRPLIEKIKDQYPEKRILLTFFSPSGYEIRKDYHWPMWSVTCP